MVATILVTGPIASADGSTIRSIAPTHELLVVDDSLTPAALNTVDIAYLSHDCYPDGVRAFMRAARAAPYR